LQPVRDYLDRLAIDLVDPHPNHGQVAKAFQTNFFAKWGKDYLRSFVLFHAVEQCGNFKDVSLQLYCGMKFNEYRTNASKIFMSIPSPQARYRNSMYVSSSSCSVNSQTKSSYDNQRISMAQFYDPSGVCFDGDSIVELNNCKKRVRELKKGDILIDGGIVECVIETEEFGSICESVIIQGAIFTPYHPIEKEGKWVFPCEIGQVVKISIDSWFNLILKGNKIARLNGVKSITLAHHLTQDCLAHPYFGTDAIIHDLKRCEGYDAGHVRRPHPTTILRDSNGMVTATF